METCFEFCLLIGRCSFLYNSPMLVKKIYVYLFIPQACLWQLFRVQAVMDPERRGCCHFQILQVVALSVSVK